MRILITGSADGLGKLSAVSLRQEGHDVVVHVRNRARLTAVQGLLDAGARAVVGDLADLEQTKQVAQQANAIGKFDAVIHNAAVPNGPALITVNVLAPYLLTALIDRPDRLIYLSSQMHWSGQPRLDGLTPPEFNGSYGDSKLMISTLAAALARRWRDVLSNAVDPGWVPTKMGGDDAPDDLPSGHLTQDWLATSTDPEALTSGGYWHHQHRVRPHQRVEDHGFQDELIEALAAATGVPLPE